MRPFVVICCFFFLSLTAQGQTYKNGEKFKLGILGGFNLTSMYGTELINPTPKQGFTVGTYYRHKLNNKLHSLVEAKATFKGSNFKTTRDGQYNQFDLVYVDMPLHLMIDLVGTKNEHLLLVGVQPAALVNARVFVRPDRKAKYLYDSIGLKRFDLAAVLGYQYNSYYYGFQATLKMGVINANNNLNLTGVMQPTGTGGSIYNAALELAFLF